MKVAVVGLGVDSDVVERFLYDKRGSITQASFSVFKCWRSTQPNMAYTKMRDALLKVKKNKYILDALTPSV